MKKILIALIIMMSISSLSKAQDYNTGIGLRGGLSAGLSVKHFISSDTAIEGILSSRWRGFDITGLYEIHNEINSLDGLNWFYGFGAHIGFWNGSHANWGDEDKDYTVIGLDGILGLEYNFKEVPFNISLDWKPTLNLIGYSGFWADGGALSVRYIF